MLQSLTTKLRRPAPMGSEDGAAAALDAAAAGDPNWRDRFRAWWEGDELALRPASQEAPQARHDIAAPPPTAAPASSWSPARSQVVQSLWGEGFSSPGEAEHVLLMVSPLGLNKKQSVADIGCGLGGTTRVVAAETGAWVTGFEVDAALVADGQECSTMAGMAKKAPLRHLKPPLIDQRDRSLDAVVSKEALFAIAEKDRLHDEIHRVLKPEGQVLFTDFVMPGGGRDSPALEKWKTAETPSPCPWSVDQTVAKLRELELEVRLAEDVTEGLTSHIVDGWKRMMKQVAAGEVPPDMIADVYAEAERWALRMALFEAKDIRCYRFYATKHERIYK